MRGHLTEKADVFGFGVVALELVSGRPNSDPSLEQDKVYLLEWVRLRTLSFFLFYLSGDFTGVKGLQNFFLNCFKFRSGVFLS